MSVTSTSFRNEYAAGRHAARASQEPCPAEASAETKLGYIAERAVQTPDASEVAGLLAKLPAIRSSLVSVAMHQALANKGLIGITARSCIDPGERALCTVLQDAADAAI